MNLIYGDTNAQIISRMGSNCKRYRIAAKLTQQELADNAGVGIATVKNWRNRQTLWGECTEANPKLLLNGT